MIPIFPQFKSLEWSDREAVLQFTSAFPPYSDFNFVSMWAWNTREKMMLSQLHGNLVLLFYDYMTELPFLSFIGENSATETAHRLIEHSQLHYKENALKLIPEQVATRLSETEFKISVDEDSHDYIVPVSYLSNLDKLPRSANPAGYQCQKFLRLYPDHTIVKHTVRECVKEEYIDLFKRWAKIKDFDHRELNEYGAFVRFINNKESDNHIVSLFDGDRMIGFATYEILRNNYAVCHFAKADREYKGVYDALFFMVGRELREANIEYWNFEQDLGIPELRQSKRKYKPEFYLKKFIVEKKNYF